MTTREDLKAQAKQCRLVGTRYAGRSYLHMQLLADQLEAQAEAIQTYRTPVETKAFAGARST